MAIPIPQRPSGYRIGAEHAAIWVDAFVDIECPFSKRGWSRLRSVIEAYQDQPIAFVAHPIVLADHRQSWDLTKAATLEAKGDGSRFWDVFSYLFDRQQQFSTKACQDKTHQEVLSLAYQLMQGYGHQTDTESPFLAQLNAKEHQQNPKRCDRWKRWNQDK